MGQYFRIVNPDMEEWLDPHAFGSMSKLVEHGADGRSVLQGLHLLTVGPENGSSLSDYVRSIRTPEGEKIESSDDLPILRDLDLEVEITRCSPRHGRTAVTPVIAGRWAGSSVVTAGDYGQATAFLTEGRLSDLGYGGDMDAGSVSLYKVAQEAFNDVSRSVAEAIALVSPLGVAHPLNHGRGREGAVRWASAIQNGEPHPVHQCEIELGTRKPGDAPTIDDVPDEPSGPTLSPDMVMTV